MEENKLPNIGYPYFRFGSKDSLDWDILINHPCSTGQEIDVRFINSIKSEFPICQDWDINIIKVEKGIVVNSIPSKGTPDGINNSLKQTYELHLQKYDNPIEEFVERDIVKAIYRCFEMVLTFYKHTEFDQFYKEKLRSVLKTKILFKMIKGSEQIKFSEMLPYKEQQENIDKFKKIAFHIGQTISLMDGVEVYTKEKLFECHPELKHIILRKNLNSYEKLDNKLRELCFKASGYLPLKDLKNK